MFRSWRDARARAARSGQTRYDARHRHVCLLTIGKGDIGRENKQRAPRRAMLKENRW